MAEDFKTYDKNPIIGVVQVSKWTFGLREIILAIIAVLLLILVITFAGLFGKAESDLAKTSAVSASAIVGTSFCVDKDCLHTAARALEFMNKSVDPCENFYQYACGNYRNVKPLGPNRGSRTVFSDMYDANEDKLAAVMEKPVSLYTDWAAERKLKEFFQSCMDLYQKEKLRGRPLIDKINSVLDGWDLLGTWNEDSWDFNTVLKKVQTDFWVDAFYGPSVIIDYYNNKRRAIQISPAGVGKWMFSSWYLSPYTEQYRLDYKKFIRRVGSLLLRDSGVSLDDVTKELKLDQFVNDTFLMEYYIAEVSQNSRYTENPYLEINKVSLSDLTTETNNVINWVDQLSYLLSGATINGNTKAILLRREYFRNITAVISSLPDSDRKRILHNYLIWRVAEIYVQDLSWEYIHANREIFVDTRGYANFLGSYRYCFALARSYMPDALGFLFIADHFSDRNRQTVHDLTDHLRSALQDQLDQTPWFDDKTKQYAKEKLDLVTFKMGYPEWMNNHDTVDRIYDGLTVNVSDFFGNLLSINKHHQRLWSRDLQQGDNREEWSYNTFDTTIGLLWAWNEINAPAGILQTPIYDSSQPHYSTFGSFGALLGRFLHHIVDDWGKDYDKFGNYMTDSKTWWSNSSVEKYEPIKQCVDTAYINASETFQYPNGESFPVRISPYNTPRAIAITSGVRLALKGYSSWASDLKLVEKMLPGLSLTNQQMLMLSWAQTECSNRNEREAFYFAIRGNVEEEIVVNTVLGQLKEFADAFQCKVGDTMNHAERCEYF